MVKGVVEDKPSAAALVGEMTTLMKSLRSLKAIQVKYMESVSAADMDGSAREPSNYTGTIATT